MQENVVGQSNHSNYKKIVVIVKLDDGISARMLFGICQLGQNAVPFD